MLAGLTCARVLPIGPTIDRVAAGRLQHRRVLDRPLHLRADRRRKLARHDQLAAARLGRAAGWPRLSSAPRGSGTLALAACTRD